jgi:sigma-B regulation protein RsbU (phosphoserine phosphatase)
LIDTGIELSKYGKQNSLYEFALERSASLTNSVSAFFKISNNSKNDFEQYYTFPKGINPDEISASELKIDSSFNYRDKTYHLVLSGKETRKGLTSFNELDKLLLDAVMKQLSASIENEFLHRQSLEKERIEQELNVAASIQQRIIPKELSAINGYDISGINIPSKEVGGDYYDCIKTDKNKFALVIADVAGKGISAALLVNTLHAALYSYLELNTSLSEMFSKLNKLIYNSSPSDKYITCFMGVLDSESGSLDAVNAGHNPILLMRKDNAIQKINAGGTGLGMLDFGIPFLGEKLVLNPGDKLFLYTDGIPEAMNENEEEYSEARMVNFLKNHSGCTAEEFINALVEDVKLFVQDAPQSDDITALILKRN